MQATKIQAHRREQSASKGSPMTPMMLTLILILIPTVTGVAGQLLLKVGMSQLGTLDISVAAIPSLIMRIILSPYIIVGLAIYFGGVFFWLLALNRADLSYVYPFASLSYVLITLASWLLLNESVPPMRWIGLVIICIGVMLVARS
ncbi:MAG: EamA family transporter [Roseiflexus sp.]|nr:EamA family transporter [Roseiflexus sp.]MBO9334583.1 EamA family transporter [Roseiflexus sp.]MBO9364975.1 EamA family transporter [Roseiflexus sp.]MBO9382650.1 EamA family transporter [Roseiflexus sp.]MBO9387618.1 EamA family transporter [Roseiflexus sp.]